MEKTITEKKIKEKTTDKELRTWLEPHVFGEIKKIKERLGIRNTTEVIRFIIHQKYVELFEESPIEKFIKNLRDLTR